MNVNSINPSVYYSRQPAAAADAAKAAATASTTAAAKGSGAESKENASAKQAKATTAGNSTEKLTPEQQHEVRELQKRDREVKAHEAAHMGAAGGLNVSGPSYEYKTGPDGQRYAVGGEVQVSAPANSSDPGQALRDAISLQRAALAPANPSAQDKQVAAEAAAKIAEAQAKLAATANEQKQRSVYASDPSDPQPVGANIDTFA